MQFTQYSVTFVLFQHIKHILEYTSPSIEYWLLYLKRDCSIPSTEGGIFTFRNSSCGKKMFFTSVCHSVGRGACVAGGVYMVAGHAWQGGVHSKEGGMCGRGCGTGACMARGHVWQVGGMHGNGACVAEETAIAADGTHPTGMHSC